MCTCNSLSWYVNVTELTQTAQWALWNSKVFLTHTHTHTKTQRDTVSLDAYQWYALAGDCALWPRLLDSTTMYKSLMQLLFLIATLEVDQSLLSLPAVDSGGVQPRPVVQRSVRMLLCEIYAWVRLNTRRAWQRHHDPDDPQTPQHIASVLAWGLDCDAVDCDGMRSFRGSVMRVSDISVSAIIYVTIPPGQPLSTL